MVSSDPRCPIRDEDYRLVADLSGTPWAEGSAAAEIRLDQISDGRTLLAVAKPKGTPGTVSIFIQATTLGGVIAHKALEVEFSYIPTIMNSGPEFESSSGRYVIPDVLISVTEAEQQAGTATSFEYTSPAAWDREDDPISLDFSGCDGVSGVTFVPESDHFVLFVAAEDLSEADAGTYSCVVSLLDDSTVFVLESQKYRFSLTIEYEAAAAAEDDPASEEEGGTDAEGVSPLGGAESPGGAAPVDAEAAEAAMLEALESGDIVALNPQAGAEFAQALEAADDLLGGAQSDMTEEELLEAKADYLAQTAEIGMTFPGVSEE